MCIIKVMWKKNSLKQFSSRSNITYFEKSFLTIRHIIFLGFCSWYFEYFVNGLYWGLPFQGFLRKKSLIEKKIITPFNKNPLTAIQATLLRHCVSCFWLASIGRECYFRLLFTTNLTGVCLETISDRTLFFLLKLKFSILIGNWDFCAVFCSLYRTYMCSTVCSHEYSSQIHYWLSKTIGILNMHILVAFTKIISSSLSKLEEAPSIFLFLYLRT